MELDDNALEARLEQEIRLLEEELHQLEPRPSGEPAGMAQDASPVKWHNLSTSTNRPTRVESTNAMEAAYGYSCPGLEDLPVEHVCLFLPMVGLAALRMVGDVLGAKVCSLLDRVAQQWRSSEAFSLGVPLLLPLIRFLHGTQSPRLALRAGSAGGASLEGLAAPIAFREGLAVSVLPAGWAGAFGNERWCPLRLEGAPGAGLHRSIRGVSAAYRCSCSIGGHVTPHFLRAQVCCQPAPDHFAAVPGWSDISLNLVDTAAPEQPLFSVTWDCSPLLAGGGGGTPETLLNARVRVVARCRGSAGAWQYQQKAWPLGLAFSATDASPGARWLQLHVEFDWEACLCAALVDRRVEGPLELQDPDMPDPRLFSGCEPTVDQLQIRVVPGIALAFSELVLA